MSESARAVFLSYASQDTEAARRICDALRKAGFEVWFDQSELRGGDAWDASIRKQIRECALFVPLISANTDARSEGYFRLEWRLAVERSHLMADDQAFLLPVVIDDTQESLARVPDRFRERQWFPLPEGAATTEFVHQVTRLLAAGGAPGPLASTPRAALVPAEARKRHWLIAIGALSAMLIAGALVFTALDRQNPGGAPQAGVATADVPALDPKSIAVLPFENLSGRAEDAYLADGLQEEILNALARLRDLKVISRASVAEYRGKTPDVREIGKRLGVGTILEGSIRRQGNTLRLTVQLIDVRDDRHLLAANYDRDLAHILDLQSAVARQVAEALAATLTLRERGELDRVATNSGDAYDRYLRAIALFRQPVPNDETGVVESKRLLGEALRFDPDYADAHALLSRANTWAYGYDRRPENVAAAKKAFERALALDPQLPEAQLARGLYTLYVTGTPHQALPDLEAVARLRPNSAETHSILGYALRREGRMSEALEHQVRARDLDPLNHTYSGVPIETLLGLRRFPEAIDQTRILAERFPGDPGPYFVRARIESYVQKSAEPLRKAFRDHGSALDPEDHKVVEAEIARAEGRYLDAVRLWDAVPTKDPVDRGELIGFLYLAAGDTGRAAQAFRGAERDALRKRERPSGAEIMQLGLIQTMLGKHAAALASVEKARRESPEALDAINGPQVSFVRSVILVRAGRSAEGYAEVERLLRVPFGAPVAIYQDPEPVRLLLKDDPRYDELLNHPPRL